jgi:hypothetical protein
VPLTGHDHVIVTIETQFAGPAGFVGSECRNATNQRSLALLAAKCAAHPPTNHSDVL